MSLGCPAGTDNRKKGEDMPTFEVEFQVYLGDGGTYRITAETPVEAERIAKKKAQDAIWEYASVNAVCITSCSQIDIPEEEERWVLRSFKRRHAIYWIAEEATWTLYINRATRYSQPEMQEAKDLAVAALNIAWVEFWEAATNPELPAPWEPGGEP